MKKLLLFIFISTYFILGCSESENSKTYCWEFTYTTLTTMTGSEPSTTTLTHEVCNLTEAEAENIAKTASTTTTNTEGEIKITITTTVTKKRK